MRSSGPNQFQIVLSGLRFWIFLFLLIWLISSVGLWWFLKSVFILLGLLFLLPIIAVIGVRIWLQRSLITDDCPTCGQRLMAIRGQQLQCHSCGEPLYATADALKRQTPPGTVDVDVVDVSAVEEGKKYIEDEKR